MLLLGGISELLEDRRVKDFNTALHKILASTNIRGNGPSDAAAKLAATHYDSLPEI